MPSDYKERAAKAKSHTSRRSSSPKFPKSPKSPKTTSKRSRSKSSPKALASKSKSGLQRFGPVLTASTLGSILGSTFGGSSCASKMYKGRDANTGEVLDSCQADENPCRRELDSLINCSKIKGDAILCQKAVEDLRNCASRNRAYFDS